MRNGEESGKRDVLSNGTVRFNTPADQVRAHLITDL